MDTCNESPNYCNSRGYCDTDTKNKKYCNCYARFEGERCNSNQNLLCKDLCKNNGKCQLNKKRHYVCKCNSGYSGKYCESNVSNLININ